MTKGERIAESAVIAQHRRDRNVKSFDHPFEEHKGHSRENALHLHLRCTHPRGSSLAVAGAPAALGLTESEGAPTSTVIALDRRERNVKSINHPFDFAQGRLRTRRNTKGFWRKCLASAFTLQIILGVPLSPSHALRHRSE